MLENKTVLTGIKPTGSPHLGNLVGAIKPVIDLSNKSKHSYVFIADLHALNGLKDCNEIQKNTYEIAAAFLAMGLDLKKTTLFRQSDIPEVFALSTLLNNVTPKGMMNRSHAYKAVVEKNLKKENSPDLGVNMGLYNYPILMAADILLYNVDIVPVGKDQKQHIEFTQDIARRFNNRFGKNFFVIPDAEIQETANAIPGLDGRKMSKSYKNTIPIFESQKTLQKLIARIITDSKQPKDIKDPEESTIFQLYQSFATNDEVKNMRAGFEQGGMDYKEAKILLFEAMNRSLEEPRKKYEYYMEHPEVIDEILKSGALKARVSARKTLKKVKDAMLGHSMILENNFKANPEAGNDTKQSDVIKNIVRRKKSSRSLIAKEYQPRNDNLEKINQNSVLRESFLARAGCSRILTYKNKASSPEVARELQLLARDLARTDERQKIVLTTGLGLSDKGVPLRLPSLIVPGLNMLRELKKIKNAEPHYIIYQARDFIIDMNKLDVTSAFNNAALCTDYLEKFVNDFFPDLKNNVTILSGDKIKLNQTHLETLAKRLAKSQNSPIEEDMKKIESYASRRKTLDNSHLYYAAANVILNGGYGAHYPIQDHLPEGTTYIIPLGGKKEKPFFNLTTFISQETNSPQKIIPVILPVGQIPAYYPNRKGDLLLVDTMESSDTEFLPPSEIKDDFALLETLDITIDKLRKTSLSL